MDLVLGPRAGSSKNLFSFPLQIWRATQSALCTDEEAQETEHRWVLHWGEPAENQHMALCKTRAACSVPPLPRVPKCQRACGHSCARGKLLRCGSRDLKLMLTWHGVYSYLKSHSFGKGTHHLGWLAATIPHLPLRPLLQRITNPCGGTREQVAAI